MTHATMPLIIPFISRRTVGVLWAAAAGILGVLTLHFALPASAAGTAPSPPEFEVDYRLEPLRSPDWRNILVQDSRKFLEPHSLYRGLRETQRFGLADKHGAVYRSGYFSLAPTWAGVVDTSLTATPELLPEYTPLLEYTPLPKYSLGAQIQKLLPNGWIASVGFRHNEFRHNGYTQSTNNLRTFSLERYWGDFRGAYTLFSGKPDGGSAVSAHRLQFNYAYSNAGSVGLAYTTGREVNDGRDNLRLPNAPFAADVRSLSLAGGHWFARDWAVTYEALALRPGDSSRREGLRLGLRYRF
jgi:YaiO family outer membrane protein